ncbi:MAG: DUF4249 family protein [Runella sp.]
MKRCSILIFLGLISYGCEVISTRTLSIPQQEPQLVALGLVTNLGAGVYVTKTVDVVGGSRQATSEGAEVNIIGNGVRIEQLKKIEDLYISTFEGPYTSDFVLEIKTDAQTATIKLDSLPAKVKIKEGIAQYSPSNQNEAQITFGFQDVGNEQYYAYSIFPLSNGIPAPNHSIYKIPLASLTPNRSFRNQYKTISLKQVLNATPQKKVNQIRIYLYTLSKSTYQYYQSLSEYDSYIDDTFAEVSPVKNNVKNSFGFVGMCSIDSLTINIK